MSPSIAAAPTYCDVRISTTFSTRSCNHQAPDGPSTARKIAIRVLSGRWRISGAPRWLPTSDQPGPSGDSGLSSRSFNRRGPIGGGPAQSTRGSRTSRCTPAPASWSSAALSSADCPAPITATSEPANFERSAWLLACDTAAVGSGSPPASAASSGGVYVNCTCPAAITTDLVVNTSPDPSVTSKPAPERATFVTFSCSIGTSCSWNQRP